MTRTDPVASRRIGKHDRKPSTTIDQPSAQRMVRKTGPSRREKVAARRRAVTSSKTSHRPRLTRKAVRLSVWPRPSQRKAPIPVVKKKTGAQRCVTQRVKKRATVVRVRSSGEKDMAPK